MKTGDNIRQRADDSRLATSRGEMKMAEPYMPHATARHMRRPKPREKRPRKLCLWMLSHRRASGY